MLRIELHIHSLLYQVVHANVVSLDLSESDVSDIGLAALVVCRRLQKIDLNAVKGTRTNVTYQGLYVFMTLCLLCVCCVIWLRNC